MKYIYVDDSGDEFIECPLRTDLHCCGAVDGSEVNDCPSLGEDDGKWSVPDWCPLKEGVCVKFKDKQ